MDLGKYKMLQIVEIGFLYLKWKVKNSNKNVSLKLFMHPIDRKFSLKA